MINTGLGQISKNLCNLVSKALIKTIAGTLEINWTALMDGFSGAGDFLWLLKILKNIRMETLPEGYWNYAYGSGALSQ